MGDSARTVVLVLAIGAAAGCGSRAGVRLDPPAVARADVLIAQGCYDCLVEARDVYDQAAAKARGGALAALQQRSFQAQLLIVLREKELALDSSAALARARTLAARLDPTGGAARVVDLVEASPSDSVGTPKMDQPRLPLGQPSLTERFKALDVPWLSSLSRAYLASAFDCAGARIPGARPAPPPAADAAPLLIYRHAICGGSGSNAALERVHAAVPRFVETSLFRGRTGMAAVFGGDPFAPLALLEEAYARFPQSPAVTMHLGTLYQAMGDCRAAMRYFDETVALRDRHEDGRLGRTICRTYLREPEAAIAEATALFDLRSYNQGEALYWRAWNLREQKQLASARADIDRTRTLLYNSRVLTLAGMIEHDQNELDAAEADLLEARSLENANCPAAWYLGVVRYRQQRWLPSAAAFSDAETCYADSVTDIERRREQMATRTDVDQAFRERQLAGFDAALQEDRSQRSAAALNAAMNFARAGDIPNANKYIDSAAGDPARAVPIAELRKAIEGRR